LIRWVLCGDDDDNPKHMQIHVNFIVQKVGPIHLSTSCTVCTG